MKRNNQLGEKNLKQMVGRAMVLFFVLVGGMFDNLNARAASEKGTFYIDGFGGATSISSTDSFLDGIGGIVYGVGVGVGVRVADSIIGFDAMARRYNFDTKKISVDVIGGTSYSIEVEPAATSIGFGPRLFLLGILNAHFGVAMNSVSLNAKVSGLGADAYSTYEGVRYGFYYGAGIQIPLWLIDIGVDYTRNRMAPDFGTSDLTGLIRVKF